MSADLVAAVDIGATKTLLAVRSVEALADGWSLGEVVARSSTEMTPGDLVEWVAAEVRRARPGRLAGIGVAAPGPLDAAHGVITRSSNLGWVDVPLAAMLEERLRAPVSLEDDANAAALGEWHFGAGTGADPMAYVTVSSGIGGGIVVGGEVVRGASGNAGEIGQSSSILLGHAVPAVGTETSNRTLAVQPWPGAHAEPGPDARPAAAAPRHATPPTSSQPRVPATPMPGGWSTMPPRRSPSLSRHWPRWWSRR